MNFLCQEINPYSKNNERFFLIRKHLLIALLLLLSQKIFCQNQLDSLNYIGIPQSRNTFTTGFNKQLNTYNLTSGILYNPAGPDLNLLFSEHYNSTYIKSFDKSSRDEHFFSFKGSYKLFPFLNIGTAVNNNILSDSRKIEINQASVSDAAFFAQFFPSDKITFAPFVGYENNRQIGQNDNGLLYGGEGSANNLDISNFLLQSQIKFKNEDISPRKNAIRYMNLSVINESRDEFTNIINFQYFLNRKDFYFAADSITSNQFGIVNNIQSRIETNNVLQDKLSYDKFLDIFSLDLTGRVMWRSIDRNTKYRPVNLASTSLFDTRIDEMRMEFESVTGYKSDLFNGSLHVGYSERDEKHAAKDYPGSNRAFFDERSQIESQKNNISRRIAVSLIGTFKLSGSDELSFSLYQNKLRYDTPSPINYDDRDELLSIARIQYAKQLTPFFSGFVNMEGTFNHIVYIFSEKSSNNNINRILRLSTGGSYLGKYISSYNAFEVSANYTVYDFEDLLPNYQSYSFRQFTATDSSKIRLARNLVFSHYGYLKLSEQGNLKWAAFSTQPTRYLEELFTEPKIITSFNKIFFTLGLRYYALITFRYISDNKVPDSKYKSIGPLTGVTLSIANSLNFNITGWYEFIKIDNNIFRQQANMSMQVTWNF